jgi:hypothetical protein
MTIEISMKTHIKALVCAGYLIFAINFSGRAQAVSVSVYPVKDLSFGAFILGNVGGTVTVSNDGTRTSTGDLVLGNFGVFYFPATFEIEAQAGTIISILNGPDVQLSGSNGGNITLRLGTSDLGSPFTTTLPFPQRTTVNIGGRLTIGTQQTNPAGNYSGTFSVTFVHQ